MNADIVANRIVFLRYFFAVVPLKDARLAGIAVAHTQCMRCQWTLTLCGTLLGCGVAVDDGTEALEFAKAIPAHCAVHLEGKPIDFERYVAGVVWCEMGSRRNAGAEALKAQAIAARSVGYHSLEKTGKLPSNDQSGQVFSGGHCPRPVSHEVQAAVEQTRGVIMLALAERSRVVAHPFYVDGSVVGGKDCNTSAGYISPLQPLVTRPGEKSRQGDNSPANIGTMSQNGARCLAAQGRNASAIFREYYTPHLLVHTAGPCTKDSHLDPQLGVIPTL